MKLSDFIIIENISWSDDIMVESLPFVAVRSLPKKFYLDSITTERPNQNIKGMFKSKFLPIN